MPLPSSLTTPGRIWLAIRGYTTRPPTYFAQHLQSSNNGKEFAPSPQNIFSSPAAMEQSNTNHHQQSQGQNQGQQQQHRDSNDPVGSSRLSTIRDLSVVVSILSLTYFALDNYRVRTTLEQRSMEQSVAHMKSMAIAQNKVNIQRKNRELQVLNERKQTQKREMKMVYHIAMLRKQLIDAGLTPIEIDSAMAEFEKNVKMETAISNVSGTALWVVDESPMKGYVPNVHDYDSKKP